MRTRHWPLPARPARLARIGASLLLAAAAAAHAQAPHQAGTVVFVSGPAELVAADGTRSPVKEGMQVFPGQQVTTAADGYVHVRMVDDAFVAVRPSSKLVVDLYEYDPANPAASRIRLQLVDGNARTVSGKGGEAARRNYRFNTPMAAIGLRGTDYTVVASPDTTRVSVTRGAVTVTPVGADCSLSTLGPCATAFTRELNAGIRHAYLEVNRTRPAPVLVRPEQDPQGGSGQNPAGRPEEPKASAGSELRLAAATEATTQVAADRIAAGLSATPAPAAPPADFLWGRWAMYAAVTPGSPAMATLMTGSRELLAGNDVFALIREGALPDSIPSLGAFSFKLAGSEAYTLNNGTLGAAQVQSGTFGVDFSQRTYNTTLAVQYAGGVEQLASQGAVNFQGLLIADPARSNMTVNGGISGSGTQAAYVFDRTLSSGSLVGVTRWVR